MENAHGQPNVFRGDRGLMFEPRSGSPTIHATAWTGGRTPSVEGGGRLWGEVVASLALKEGDDGISIADDKSDIKSSSSRLSSIGRHSIEYDVVKCADYIHEKNAWAKVMPDEIRRIDSSFVPP